MRSLVRSAETRRKQTVRTAVYSNVYTLRKPLRNNALRVASKKITQTVRTSVSDLTLATGRAVCLRLDIYDHTAPLRDE